MWQRRAKLSKGIVSAKVWDPGNQLRVNVEGKKVSLGDSPVRLMFGFPPQQLQAGVYRVDLVGRQAGLANLHPHR